jgi:hypothetical protein
LDIELPPIGDAFLRIALLILDHHSLTFCRGQSLLRSPVHRTGWTAVIGCRYQIKFLAKSPKITIPRQLQLSRSSCYREHFAAFRRFAFCLQKDPQISQLEGIWVIKFRFRILPIRRTGSEQPGTARNRGRLGVF